MVFDFNRDAAKTLDKKQAQNLLLMKGFPFYVIGAVLLLAAIVLMFFKIWWLVIVLIVLALAEAGRSADLHPGGE